MARLVQGLSRTVSFRGTYDKYNPSLPTPGKVIVECMAEKCNNGGVLKLGKFGRTRPEVEVRRLIPRISCSSSIVSGGESGEESSRSSKTEDGVGNSNLRPAKSSASSFFTEYVERERENSRDSSEGLTDSVERERESSRDSSEGLATSCSEKTNETELELERERDRSRDSIEGLNASSSDTRENERELVENNSEWKNVFPAYMQSRENEVEQESEEGCNGTVANYPRQEERNVGATKAAAAAVAFAKEYDSQFGSRLLSSDISDPTEAGKLKDLISNDPIWAAIRAEARLEGMYKSFHNRTDLALAAGEFGCRVALNDYLVIVFAEREPLLSSFLYASILAHSCFERSLGFVLANRLKNATLLATQLLDIFDDVFMHDVTIRQAVRLDVQAVKDRDPSCRSYSLALLYLKGYHAIQAYRIAHALWNRGQKVLALALQSRISEVLAVDIHPAARMGKAILLDHGTGVVIGETAVVGDRVSMLHGVTLGGTGKAAGDRHPKIREGVLIGAGATILGNIVVGKGAMVAAGSLVLKDVPPHSMVAGTPAKVVGYLDESIPSLTMKQDATKNFCQELQSQELFDGGGI